VIATLAIAAALQAAPLDWNSLPPLPYRAPPLVTPDMHAFVRRDATARKCPLPAAAKGMTVEVAILVDQASAIRVTVPRSVRCPTVEQYAAALVAAFARNNLLPRSADSGEQWYKTSVSFAWGA
jgi:hypothetical protein